MTPEQETSTQDLIIDKAPGQLKMVYALWTRKAVLEFIEDEIGNMCAAKFMVIEEVILSDF